MDFEKCEQLDATSWRIGEEIDLKGVARPAIVRSPLTVAVGEGLAVLYRFGAVVLFGVAEGERRELFSELLGGAEPPAGEGDAALLSRAREGEREGIGPNGTIVLRAFDLPRLRVVAEVLARSAIVAHYESSLGGVLGELDPPIARLRHEGRLPFRTRSLLRNVGEALDTELRMVGRAEVAEKPEFVWDEPELDRLYAALADEYELVDRDRALSRKLDLVTRAVTVLMEALSARRSLHVEWAIFALILAEIVLLV